MTLRYEDLISGDPIFIDGICHVRSPFLWETKPTKGIRIWKYNLYLQALTSDKDDAVKFLQLVRRSEKAVKAIQSNSKINSFDIFTLVDDTRELLTESLRFFIVEELFWDSSTKRFIVKGLDENADNFSYIDRNNFEAICGAVMQLNYVNVETTKKPKSFASEEARILWERAQEYLKNTGKKKAEDKSMNLGNLISKFCSLSNNYTLLNVYELTIFQFYDQLFQCAYMKAMNIGDMAYSMHGGDKYDSQAWMKPIYKY